MLIQVSRIRAATEVGGFRVVLDGKALTESSLIARPGHLDLMLDVATGLIFVVSGGEVHIIPTTACAQIMPAPDAVPALKQWLADRAKPRGKAA